MTAEDALDKLRAAGELTLIWSRWCTRDGDRWHTVLSISMGMRLVREKRARLVGGNRLQPAEPAGGE